MLSYVAPDLLVYLVAFVVALAYRGRASTPAVLTLLGVGVLVVATVGGIAAQAWLVETHPAHDRNSGAFDRQMASVAMAAGWVRSIGLGLLVTAIFVGRRAVVGRQAEPIWAPAAGRE